MCTYSKSTIESALFIFYLCLVFFVISTNQTDDASATILAYKNEGDYPNNYHFMYQTSNGITREEIGRIILSKSGEEILEVQGSYSFIGTDNVLYQRQYIADDKGYRELTPNLGTRIGTPAVKSLQGGGLG